MDQCDSGAEGGSSLGVGDGREQQGYDQSLSRAV
jgi:hypothetical protein